MATLLNDLNNRTGLIDVFRDHSQTWSIRDGKAKRHDRILAVLWFYGLPLLLAAIPVGLAIYGCYEVRIGGLGPILSGVSIFTALLFGLLVLMFNTGVAVKKDRAVLDNAHGVAQVIDDARANVTYSALVALVLACTLVVAAASNRDPSGILQWQWSVPLIFLGTHLMLNVLIILKRLRVAFNNITR